MERTDITEAVMKDLTFLRQREGAVTNRIEQTQLLGALVTSKNIESGFRTLLRKHRPKNHDEWRAVQVILRMSIEPHRGTTMYDRRATSSRQLGITDHAHRRREMNGFTAIAESLADAILADSELTAKAELALASPNPIVRKIERLIKQNEANLAGIKMYLDQIHEQYS